jgi:hypothetical protein
MFIGLPGSFFNQYEVTVQYLSSDLEMIDSLLLMDE